MGFNTEGQVSVGEGELPEGFTPWLVKFHAPNDPAYDFKTFYQKVKERGYILYPGKLTQIETFRVGCMGHFDEAGIPGAVAAIGAALADMGVATKG